MPVFRKNGKNILFIHVPKCGGSSIENAFLSSGYEALYLKRGGGRRSSNYVLWCSPQHMHAELFRPMFRMDRFDGVFMVVREPLARFRSEYVFRNRKLETVSPKADAVTAWADKTFATYEKNAFVHDNHMRPQHEFWVPETVVYRLEDGLEAMFDDLNSRFDLDVQPEAERRLHSEKEVGFSSSDVELTDDLARRLVSFYREDFEKFGYNTDGTVPAAATPSHERAQRPAGRLLRTARSIAAKLQS